MRPAAEPGSLRALVRDIVAFARWRLAGVAGLAVLAAAAEGMGLLMLVPVLQFAGIGGSGAGLPLPPIGLGPALALYVLLVALAALVVAVRGSAVAALRSDYADDLRRRLHHALMGMEFSAFSRMRASDIQHAAILESGRAAHGVDFLLRLAGWAVEIPVLLAVALRLSPALTGASLVLAALCLALTLPLSRQAHAIGQRQVETGRALQGDLADDLAGMRVIRGLGLEDQRHRRFGDRVVAVQAAHLAFQRVSGLTRAATSTLAATAAAVAVWLAVRVLDMALADTLALMVAFARLLTMSIRIQDAWRTVLNTLPAHTAVHALEQHCRAAAEPAVEPGEPPLPPRQDIVLSGVTFGYDPAGAPVLHAIDARIPARTMTAVIGPSGAGKSTLADLLLGLLPPDHGHILIDGQPLAGPLRQRWRSRVGYVPQDAFLFHDTIRANLTMAAPQAGEADLWAALDRAAAADFVRALPQGLDTVVGDRGSNLSGGERQRLALARVLLTSPALLILDEATSALDGENERRVLDALEGLRGQLTMIVIAHRASTVRTADHIIVLDGGRIVAAGSWAEASATALPTNNNVLKFME